MKKLTVVICFILTISVCCSYGCKSAKENITTYVIDCCLTDNLLTGNEKVTFVNNSENTFSHLKFNLFMNAYRENAKYPPLSKKDEPTGYYAGLNYGGTEILSVVQGDNKLNYEITGEDENILDIELQNELFPEEKVTIEIEFTVTLAKIISRTGITPNTINLGNFYPILCGIEDGAFYECMYYANGDPFFSEVADYDVTFSCSSEYVVASSGLLVSSKEVDGNRCANYKIDKARSFCFVLSKEFESITQNIDGIDITYYFFDGDSPQKSLDIAVDSIKTFTKLFGEYKYKNYSVVKTPFNQGGMEYTALSYISSDLDSSSFGEVIVHETAHQWWQTAVGNNEIKYGFLDEGLAEYSVILFYEANPKYNIKRSDLVRSAEKTYKTYCSVFDKLYGNVDTSMTRKLNEYKSEYEYVCIAYIKSCLMHEYLRSTIGDEKYFGCLREYYKEFSFSIATPNDLVGIFEKNGADTNGFFNSFFTGQVIL